MTDQVDRPANHPAASPGDAELDCNPSANPLFTDVVQRRLSRRQLLSGTAALMGAVGAAALIPGVARAGGSSGQFQGRLGFAAIPVSREDRAGVPEGYHAQPFLPWGTPITGSYPDYRDGGLNSGEEQEQQVGMHHDGMHYFPLGRGLAEQSRHGILCINHEYVAPEFLHAAGATRVDGVRTVVDEVRKEVAAHGVSVVEIARDDAGRWDVVRGPFNRRITAGTEMEITGPVRGDDLVRTRFSPDGVRCRGTLNNCANGYTPWGTYLTCEENWAGYFVNDDAAQPREHKRYGVSTSASHDRYSWHTRAEDEYARFNAAATGASALADYRNEPNTFGWVVEIDPMDPASTPKKRTALGRFAHEGAWPSLARFGQRLAIYMGDDSRFEYIYKFVTRDAYWGRKTDRDLLDHGTLYVARFNEDGSGDWLALEFGQNGLTPENGFHSQADILVNTRTAADFVGATKMDRPEWGAVHPVTGDVYMTLTNNSARTVAQIDAANPRGPNPYGHIIRWREHRRRPHALRFEWEIFVLAGPAAEGEVLPGSARNQDLTEDNSFASPDGLWFDERGMLWIQTDMSGSQLTGGPFGNNGMLVADPTTGDIRRFFTGPVGCEVTGIAMPPDARTLFLNIQHPGEQGPSHWPDGGEARPRSATVIVTRDDGQIIGR